LVVIIHPVKIINNSLLLSEKKKSSVVSVVS
jgi:hypothetical protein